MIKSPHPTAHIFLDASSLFCLDALVPCELTGGGNARKHWFKIILELKDKFDIQFYVMDMVMFEFSGILPDGTDIDKYFPGSTSPIHTPLETKKFFQKARQGKIPNFSILASPEGRAKKYLDGLLNITTQYPYPCASATNAIMHAQRQKPNDAGDYSTVKAISQKTAHIEVNGGKVFLMSEDHMMSIAASKTNGHTCDVVNVAGLIHAILQPAIAESLGLFPNPNQNIKDTVKILMDAIEDHLSETRINHQKRNFYIIDTDINSPEINLWHGAFYKWAIKCAEHRHITILPLNRIATGRERFNRKFGSIAHNFGKRPDGRAQR